MLSPELLDILVCPLCKGKINPNEAGASLDCPVCELSYPVTAGIPVMLPAEAQPLAGHGEVTKKA